VNGSTSMKCWWTIPILAASASWAAADNRRPAAYEDLASVGLVVAVQDPHQGRLAGTVLADDAVDRAPGTASDTSRLA